MILLIDNNSNDKTIKGIKTKYEIKRMRTEIKNKHMRNCI